MSLLSRNIETRIREALADTPVVVLNGARQVGKTTLTRSLCDPDRFDFVTLDEPGVREAARIDPRSFIERPVETLVIDEAQLEPSLFRVIKGQVDRDRRPGRFLLTGSSRLLAAPDMADALVGRVEPLELWPLSQGEMAGVVDRFVDRVFEDPRDLIRGRPLERADIISRVMTGGFPEAVARSGARRARWFASYETTIAQSVIRGLSEIERLGEIPRLLRLCAARTASELNVTGIARDFGISPRTMAGYLSLLATAFLVHLVPAWSTNLSSKVVRRPKLVISDSGLAAHLLGATAEKVDSPSGGFGPLLETFVINELRKQLSWCDTRSSLHHFRDRGGTEVDVVLEHPDGRIVGIEVKATRTPSSSDLSGLRFLRERLGDRFHFGVLLHLSPDAIPFGPRLAALPVSALWERAA